MPFLSSPRSSVGGQSRFIQWCRPARRRDDGPALKLALTIQGSLPTLTSIVGKDALIAEMAHAAHLMVQGSLSEVTRQCGDPSCACAWDPARRHGPHLYLKFAADGKAYSIYIPPEEQEVFRQAHHAWLRFNEIAGRLAGD